MSYARKVAVRGTAELDQFEEAFLGVFAAKDLEAIAIVLRASADISTAGPTQ